MLTREVIIVSQTYNLGNMSWRKREREEYSFYITGFVILCSLLIIISAVVEQLFFK